AICFADEAATAPCSVPADCCDDWTPPEPPFCDCEPVCVVGAAFEASPVEPASFVCELDAESGAAAGWCPSDPPVIWSAPERTEEGAPGWRPEMVESRPEQPQPPCFWVELCVVDALFDALADELAVFDCDTEPSSPGPSTRTEMLSFEGCTCVALEAAV